MMENGYRLGGEQSGHIIFSKHATTGDGILTSLKIMEVLLEKKTTLGTLASEVKIYPQLLDRQESSAGASGGKRSDRTGERRSGKRRTYPGA